MTSPAERQWIGLCEEYCHAQSLPLSTANLEAANRFWRSIYVRLSSAASLGATNEQLLDQLCMYALKVLVALKLGFEPTPEVTASSLESCQQS